MTTPPEEVQAEIGRVAYEMYREHVHGRSLVTGAMLPPWDELDPAVSDAWTAAAHAVEDAVKA